MRYRRSVRSRLPIALIAVVCLAAQLSLAGAGLWHHHDDGDARHDDCAVCIAVAADRTDGLPPPVLVPAPPHLIGLIDTPIHRGAGIAVPRHCLARGPPMA